jgi:hypothetical protein
MTEIEVKLLVSDCVGNVIEHYRQPIHEVGEVILYFDAPLERPLQIPPVVQYCINRLQLATNDSELVVRWLILSYISQVRQSLIDEHNQLVKSGISPLVQFEMLMSQYIEKQTPIIRPDSCPLELSEVMITLACDITLLTIPSQVDTPSVSPFTVSNIVLASLLRVLVHALRLYKDQLSKKALLRCSVSVLAFGESLLSPSIVNPVIDRELDVVMDHAIRPNKGLENVKLASHWGECSLDGTYWNDRSVCTASRVANTYWRTLSNSHFDEQDSKKRCLGALGHLDVAKAVRAHFYGRDMPPVNALAKPMKHLHMGSTVMYTPESQIRKEYDVIPSRVHVFLHFIMLLEAFDEDILHEILPVLYEMLSSPHDSFLAMASAAILHLCFCKTEDHSLVSNSTHLLQLLDKGISMCRDGPVVAILGLAQNSLFRLSPSHQNVNERRKALQQWLFILDRSANGTMNISLISGVLRGGLLPLLKSFASSTSYDGMEAGRLGLAALLPLLQSESFEYPFDIQFAGLLALQSLLFAAYPIMHRHGGKIVTALLVVANSEDPHLRDLAIQVAMEAVVLCGSRAQEVIQQVIESPEAYLESFVAVAKTIEDGAIKLQCVEGSSL